MNESELEKWLNKLEELCELIVRGHNKASHNELIETLKQYGAPPWDRDLEERLTERALSPESRVIRRNLLIAATVTSLVSLGAKPSVLVTFEGVNWLPIVSSALVTLFLVVEFFVYVASDEDRFRGAVVDQRRVVEKLEHIRELATFAQLRDLGQLFQEALAKRIGEIAIPKVRQSRSHFDHLWPKIWAAFSLGLAATRILAPDNLSRLTECINMMYG